MTILGQGINFGGIGGSGVVDWPNWTGDNFTGTNGADPNPDYWYTHAANAGYTTINSNDLRGISSAAGNDRFTGKFGFAGDFQFELRYVRDAVANPTANDHYLMLLFKDAADATVGTIKYSRYSNGNDQPVLASWTNNSNYVQTLNTGGFKIVRASGVIDAYVWDDGDGRWEWSNDVNGFEVEPAETSFITPQLLFNWRAGGSMTIRITQVQNVTGATASPLWQTY